VVEPDVKRIQAYLNEQAGWLRNQGYQVETLVRRGDPSNEILEAAKEENTDLILMARKGRSGLAKLFFTSVAETVLRSSSCSVMIV
jgi:nucleotide-binding universal stress UspA family protein